MSSSPERNGFPSQWLSNIPALLTAIGLVLYGMLNMAYSLFYGRLGVNPEDVGLGYAATISRSTGFVVIAVSLSAAVFLPAIWTSIENREWRKARRERAEANRTAAQILIEGHGGLEALKDAAKSGDSGASMVLETARRHMEAAQEAEGSTVPFQRSKRISLIFAISAILLVLMPLAPLLALPRADAVQHGRDVPPVKVLGVTVLAIGASHASVQATGKPSDTTAINALSARQLLYLGRTDGTLVLYDSQSDQAIYIPASLVILRVNG
jgi:hypothetical protein